MSTRKLQLAIGCMVLVGCSQVAGIDDIEYGAETTLPAPKPSASTAPTTSTTPTATTAPTNDPPPVPVEDAGVDANVEADSGPVIVDPPPPPPPPPVPVDPGGGYDADFAANDRRGGAAARLIAFPNADVQYAPHCMLISITQSVSFSGDFAAYPLVPGGGVGPINPITATNAGNLATFQFIIPGKYKFSSSTSPGSMHGVIQVKGP